MVDGMEYSFAFAKRPKTVGAVPAPFSMVAPSEFASIHEARSVSQRTAERELMQAEHIAIYPEEGPPEVWIKGADGWEMV